MSKFGILKSLPTPSDLRQSASQVNEALESTVQKLDAIAAQVQSLKMLPDLVAEQVTETLKLLDPVLQMPGQVSRALEAVDQVAAVQRQTLGELAQELGVQATASIERKTKDLDETISTLTGQVKGLKSTMAAMEASSQKLQALPQKLTTAATDAAADMKTSAGKLSKAALAVIPSAWRTLGLLLAAAVLGAMLVAAGQVVLNRILPPSDLQQNAAWAGKVWAQATESERQLLTQIASRPGR